MKYALLIVLLISAPAFGQTYKNCTEVRNAGAAPLHRGDPGYSRTLDRDGDGVACEVNGSSSQRRRSSRTRQTVRPRQDAITRQNSITRTQSEDAIVYFIGNRERGVVKIGFTTNLESRLSALQTGHPYELEVFDTVEGDTDLEDAYHEKYSQYHIRGEWFRISGALERRLFDSDSTEVNNRPQGQEQ